MNFFKKIFKKKREKKLTKKNQLSILAKKKLDKIKKKRYSDKVFDELVSLFRKYLEKTFSLKKGSTHEEINEQIKEKRVKISIKNRIISISKRINEIEYSSEKKDKKKLDEIIKEFEEILNLI